MNEEMRQYINDYADGKIVEKRGFIHIIILSIIALALMISAIVLLVNHYC